jgi:hypothetical protein
MSENNPDDRDDIELHRRALSRWDNEGGVDPEDSEIGPAGQAVPTDNPRGHLVEVAHAEWTELRTRVIALENLVISLLATASPGQLLLAREMASYISPRPGSTHHPLTIKAADHMKDLVDRSAIFRSDDPS